MTSADRNRGYVPDGLYEGRSDHRVLVGPGDSPREIRHGLADENNREQTWWWAKMAGPQNPDAPPARLDGDTEHWSQFRGHKILVDVAYRQQNRREVNEWKGRDEVRAEGAWVLRFNRTQIWEGRCTTNLLWDLHQIADVTTRLLDHDAVDWMSAVPYPRQLESRKVWYRKTPARITRVLMDQGCVILQPDGASIFPPSQSRLDELASDHYIDEDLSRVKVDLLDPHVWWWRS